jgi:nucleotide-binding universal stress UspA family protein
LARETQSSLSLVRVVYGRRYSTEYPRTGVHRQHITAEWRDAEAYLADTKRRLQRDGLSVEATVREGLIAENILDVADEEHASAIVLSTHGRHGMARFFLGSVAEGLVHETRIPLFLVPAEAARRGGEPSFARILVPLDGSPLAERALEYVGDIARSDATVILVRIVSPNDKEAGVSNTLLVAGDPNRDEADAREYLQGVAQQLHGIGRKAQITTITGRPAHEILIAAKAAHADAIVMVSHGRTGLGRWRLGSVADEVIRHGDMPVFLISAHALTARSSTQLVASDVMMRSPVVLGSADTIAAALRSGTKKE